MFCKVNIIHLERLTWQTCFGCSSLFILWLSGVILSHLRTCPHVLLCQHVRRHNSQTHTMQISNKQRCPAGVLSSYQTKDWRVIFTLVLHFLHDHSSVCSVPVINFLTPHWHPEASLGTAIPPPASRNYVHIQRIIPLAGWNTVDFKKVSRCKNDIFFQNQRACFKNFSDVRRNVSVPFTSFTVVCDVTTSTESHLSHQHQNQLLWLSSINII